MRKFQIPFVIVLGLCAAAEAFGDDSGPRPTEDVRVDRPQGDYAQVFLTFDIPGAPEHFQHGQYVGGMRDGRLPIAHGHRLREPGGVLRVEGDKLSGTFTRAEGRRGGMTIAEATVEAIVRDDQITGTVRINGHEGEVTGRIIREDDLTAANSVPTDKGWPMYLGPINGGVAADPTGTAIVDSFHDARLVWRTE